MAQYQSFPDAGGDSRTLEKLKALNLPSLNGRRFLDVGCNEGFFCGFAKFQGADRAVGIDHSSLFIERARSRFSDCEFFQQSWDHLPDGKFDVILLASALHYADDQASLIHRLIEKLSPDGVLVLELGIASSSKSEWVNVKRGIDERCFPSMPMMREVLGSYAWKWIGPSILQDGDPVPRHVIHVSRRWPIAYLLLQPPGYGKTSIANTLFIPAGIPVVSGDDLVHKVANGQKGASGPLRNALTVGFSPYHIDQTIRKAFDMDLGSELVNMWLSEVGDGDFALDAYIPIDQQAKVLRILIDAGYMPVTLQWERIGASLQSAEALNHRAQEYFLSLAESANGESPVTKVSPAYDGDTGGFVDGVTMVQGKLIIRGWAVNEHGAPPRIMVIRINQETHVISAYERQSRPDVQRHLGLSHPFYGYFVSVPLKASIDPKSVLTMLEVRVGDTESKLSDPLPFSASLSAV